MRVLFTTTPYWGHVNPLLPLARAFRARGDEVCFATPVEACGRLAGLGFDVRACGRMGDEKPGPAFLARHPELVASTPPQDLPNLVFPGIFGYDRTAATLVDLLPLVDGWGPDLVIREAAEFGGPIAGARAGVPYLTHGFGALLPVVRVAAAGDAVAPLWEANGLEPRPYGGSYDHPYLDIYPPALQVTDRPHVPTTMLLGTGATIADGSGPRPDVLAAAGDRPVVYVTFGTVFNDLEPVRAVVAGARALDVFVIVTLGPDADPDGLGPQPANVHVASFIPQDDLLPHCAAVVSHAGSGTFLGALAHGVPQVCVPLGADQFLNAGACERAGAGLWLRPDTDEIRAGLDRILTEPAFAGAAAAVGRDLASMPTPAAVADELARTWGSTAG